jgi:hypothetical protein
VEIPASVFSFLGECVVTAGTSTPLQKSTSAATEYQMLQFLISQRLLKVQTVTLVQVIAVYGGGIAPVGTLDVLPLVDQIDGAGNAIPHEVLFNRPYVRAQGGQCALIVDPEVGDRGVMVFGSRDLSAVLASGKEGPPPSRRLFDYADGLYLYSIPRVAPTTYIQVSSAGIVMRAASVNINGAVISGSGIITDGDGVVSNTHVHPGQGSLEAPSSGGPVTGDTGPPT